MAVVLNGWQYLEITALSPKGAREKQFLILALYP